MQKFQNRKDKKMRLLLCGGGTAGHVNPAIAVAEELKRTHPDSKILFIGRDGGDENKLITEAGFELQTLRIQGIKRSLSLNNITRIKTAILRLPRNIIMRMQRISTPCITSAKP